MANYTWNTTFTTGNYYDLDWLPRGSAPTSSDNATIGGGVDVTESRFLDIGDPSGSTGSLTLTDASTTLDAQNGLDIGNNGQGGLSILAGATLLSTGYNAAGGASARYDIVAGSLGSVGTVLIDGAGSSWVSTSNGMTVGQQGQGSLTLSNSGSLSVQNTFTVGLFQNGNGLVTISSGGQISAESFVLIGNDAGSVGEIDIDAGASLVATGAVTPSASTVVAGLNAGSQGTIKVTGVGALLDTGGNPLYVGLDGTGSLTVSGGGTVKSATSDPTQLAVGVGVDAGSQGSVTVTGAGSSLTAAGYGLVGHGGTGTMVVSDNAEATVGDASNGFEVGAGYVFNGVLIAGGSGDLQVTSGGSFHSLSYLEVGDADVGTLEIDHASVDAAGYLDVGDGNATNGPGHGTATIGVGGTLSSAGEITVGDGVGSVGEIDVNAGGSLLGTGSAASFASYTTLGNKSGSTGTINVTGAQALLDTGGNPLLVGNDGTGSLTVSQGGTVRSGSADATLDFAFTVAGGTGSHGVVTVTGAGSSLTAAGPAEIARGGTGTMVVFQGAQATLGDASDGFYVGNGGIYHSVSTTGGSGDLQVTTGGVVDVLQDFVVGNRGDTGTAEIDQNGTVDVAGQFDVGEGNATYGPGRGTVTIATGGTLSSAGEINVGGSSGSVGEVDINAGGSLLGTGSAASFASKVTLGRQSGATGTIKVTGTGATLDTKGNPFYVGSFGTGTLTVSQGGTVSSGTSDSTTQSAIGVAGGSGSRGIVTVTGAGSSLTASGFGYVGRGGTGTMVVSDHGLATLGSASEVFAVGSGYLFNGVPTTGGSGDLQVTTDASVDVLSYLEVGRSDQGTVEIDQGGLLQAASGIVLGDGDTTYGPGNGTLTLGTSGTLSTAGFVTVGDTAGSIGELDINAGGSLVGTGSAASFTSVVLVGNQAGSTGTIKVTGAAALLNTGGNPLFVGFDGTGTMTISQGGTVESATSDSNQNVSVGIAAGSGSQGTLTVTGTGSSFTASGFGYVGRGGAGAMTVSDHGLATLGDASDDFVIGSGGLHHGVATTGGSGDLKVTTGGQVEVLERLVVGEEGDTGTLEINQGGLVEAAGQIGIGDGATYGPGTGTVTVGAGGTLRAALDPSLIPLSGGNPSASIYIGDSPGSVGTLNVAGAGALVDANGNKISVGSQRTTGTPGGTGFLTVSQGGTVDSAAATSGDQALNIASAAANVGTVVIADVGSVFNALGRVNVGNSGQGHLLVENGGVLNSGQSSGANTSNGLRIAASAGGSGDVTVTGAGSTINNLGAFLVGGAGTGQLTISAGGRVNTREGSNSGNGAEIGSSAGSSGSVLVTGQNSEWAVTGALEVGLGGSGSLGISDQGQVTADSVDIGGAGTSGTVSVTGGSLPTIGLQVASDVNVGVLGSGSLALSDGLVAVGGRLTVGSQGSVSGSGTIDPVQTTIVAGGSYAASGLLVSPLVVDNGTIAPTSGTLEIDGSVGGTGAIIVSAGSSLTLDGVLNGSAGDNVSTSIDGGLMRLASGASTGGGVITFSSGGTLEIDQSLTSGATSFGSTLSGLSAGDTIDLAGMAYGSGAGLTATVSGSFLAVSNGTATETFSLIGSPVSFNLSRDTGTGILLTATASSPVAPTIAGTVGGQTTSAEAPINPFSGVTIGDLNSGATDQLTVTLSGGGSLASPTGGLNSPSAGVYTLSGTAADLTLLLTALVFTPVAGATTTFALSDVSSAGTSASDSTTSVIDTPAPPPPAAPTITGTVGGQTTSAETPINPFSGVTIGDPNSGATDQLTVTLSGGGSLASPSGGLNSPSAGVYTLSGTPANLTLLLSALVFTPLPGATTTFALSDVSSAGTSISDGTTSVSDTPAVVLPPPPTVGFDAATTLASPNNFVFQGMASSTGTVAGVEIFEGTTDLGAANFDAASQNWSFTFNGGPGHHTGLMAVATDAQGATSTASSPFDLTTGIRGKAYTAFQTNYDSASGDLSGQTFYTRRGGIYEQTTVTTNPDGSSSQVTSGGAAFRNEAYSATRQDFDASGTPTQLELDNRDGTHSIAGLTAGQTLNSISDDTFNTVGGRNTFVFTPGFGQDTITSFVLGGRNHDTISLPPGDSGRLAAILAHGSTDDFGNTTLHINRNDTIVIAGVSLTGLQNHQADFTFHA